jgi:hypothetical protein
MQPCVYMRLHTAEWFTGTDVALQCSVLTSGLREFCRIVLMIQRNLVTNDGCSSSESHYTSLYIVSHPPRQQLCDRINKSWTTSFYISWIRMFKILWINFHKLIFLWISLSLSILWQFFIGPYNCYSENPPKLPLPVIIWTCSVCRVMWYSLRSVLIHSWWMCRLSSTQLSRWQSYP